MPIFSGTLYIEKGVTPSRESPLVSVTGARGRARAKRLKSACAMLPVDSSTLVNP
jgi:hypothetical protein